MARSLSLPQTLIRTTAFAASTGSSYLSKSTISVAFSRRDGTYNLGNYSTLYDFSTASILSDGESCSSAEALAVRNIEDAIHRIVVSRSAPAWLPLVPGASYWVPPKRRNYGIALLLRKLSATPLHPDELMSLYASRGWPSSAYYLPPNHHISSAGGDVQAHDDSFQWLKHEMQD